MLQMFNSKPGVEALAVFLGKTREKFKWFQEKMILKRMFGLSRDNQRLVVSTFDFRMMQLFLPRYRAFCAACHHPKHLS